MKFLIRAVFLFSILTFSANVAYSCTCLRNTHRKEFHQTDVIFSGQVIDKVEDKSFVRPTSVSPRVQKIIDSQKRYLVKFKVERKFKGVGGKEITLYTVESDSPCAAMQLTKGEKYLVYASRDENGLGDNGLCSRTRNLDKASKEYRELTSFWFRLRARLPFPS